MGWVFVYELSGCGFESRYCHVSFAMTTEMDIFSNRLFNLNSSTSFLVSCCFQLITFKLVILEGAIKSCSTKIAVLKLDFLHLCFKSLINTYERFIFSNVVILHSATLSKNKIFHTYLRIFLSIFLTSIWRTPTWLLLIHVKNVYTDD